MKNFRFLLVLLTVFSLMQLGMGNREGQYDEEAREIERREKAIQKSEKKRVNPLKNMAGGVKQATVDSTADFVSETADGAKEDGGLGTFEGAREGSGKVLDNTVQGAYKVATLGYGDEAHYEVKEPEKGSDETTKIKFKIPGT